MIQNEPGAKEQDLRHYGLGAHEWIVQLLTSPIKKAGFPRLN